MLGRPQWIESFLKHARAAGLSNSSEVWGCGMKRPIRTAWDGPVGELQMAIRPHGIDIECVGHTHRANTDFKAPNRSSDASENGARSVSAKVFVRPMV